jgi:hypothetical protein
VAVAVTVYNLGVGLTVWRRPIRRVRAVWWWFDLALIAVANVVAAALLPDRMLFFDNHDLVWNAWLGVPYLWTVLHGARAGLALLSLSVPLQVGMGAANGLSAAEIDWAVLSLRTSWGVVGVLLVHWAVGRAAMASRRAVDVASDESRQDGLRDGIAQGSDDRERMHDLLHGEAPGALGQMRSLADGSSDAKSALAEIRRLSLVADRQLRRRLHELREAEGPFEAELRNLVLESQERCPEVAFDVVIAAQEPVALTGASTRALLSAVREALVTGGVDDLAGMPFKALSMWSGRLSRSPVADRVGVGRAVATRRGNTRAASPGSAATTIGSGGGGAAGGTRGSRA